MSLTFTVVHQKESRKVTCERSATVSQLLSSALQKFKFPPATNGTLLYAGKRLDPASPIRFTSLVNNGKVTLEVSQMYGDVNLKVIASISGGSITRILKVKSSVLVCELVEEFRGQSGVIWPDSAKISVSVLHNAVDNVSPKYKEITVGSMVGHVPSAVVRINVETGAVKEKTENGEVIQSSQLSQKDQKVQENQKNTVDQVGLSNSSNSSNQTETNHTNHTNQANQTNQINQTQEVNQRNQTNQAFMTSSSSDTYSSSNLSNLCDPVEKVVLNVGQMDQAQAHNHPSQTHNPQNASQKNPQSTPQLSSEEPNLQGETQDVVYIPSSGIQAYENPDEDYELTSSQAEKYYKILKSMQARPKPKKPQFIPRNYTIRVRFPDRALLDLHFSDPAVKLGQVFKKVDSCINDQYLNSYKLKSSLPPFKEIQPSFDSNNIPLKDLPDFQSERVLLVWEPARPAGNYLKSSMARKNVSESPTVQLETNRGNLADDTPAPAPKKLSKGLPKWFKPGK